MLEIKYVPASLILFAITQWQYCGKYAKRSTIGNNTNPFIKGIAVWLILKNETTSGCIHGYRDQLKQLAQKCKMSVRTLEKYINWLRAEGLAERKDYNNLVLSPYNVLRKYGIDLSEREATIYYDTESKTTLAEILVAIGIQRLQDKRCIAYWKKINQNQDVFTSLSDLLIKFGADKTKLDDVQYFRECHLELLCTSFQEEEPGQDIFLFLHKVIQANPDLNAKDATYGRMFGYAVFEGKNKRTGKRIDSCQGFGYLKRKLAKKSLLKAEKDNIEGWHRARKDDKMFFVSWLKKFKHTIWYRVDQITINLPHIFKSKNHAQPAA